jgi:tetratricopeptide (TPR) repeat protein
MPKPDNPYVGPRPFERRDQSVFFGRANETSQLLSLITAHKALLVYAQSGAGKTSLINASLIPLLEAEGFRVLPPTRVLYASKDVSPNDVSNVYVFSALSGWLGSGTAPSAIVHSTLTEFLQRPDGDDTPWVLIFDQFEEIFTSQPGRWRDRAGFFDQLAQSLNADSCLRVVLVIREDYIASLDPYSSRLPEKLRPRFRLERLDERAALEAIKDPLRGTTRRYGDGVAEQLVQELRKSYAPDDKGGVITISDEFIEPVHLQIICERLWDELPDEVKEITVEHVKTFGDVDEALREFYANVVSQAAHQTKISEGRIRNWVESRLITPAQTRGTVFREKDETAGAPNVLPETLENLHLVRGDWRGAGRWYELTHDRFIAPIRRSNRVWFSEHIFQLLKKWVRQHKTFVTSLLAVSLVIIFAGNFYLYQVRKERDNALGQKHEAERQRERAEAGEKAAREAKVEADTVRNRSNSLVSLLTSLDERDLMHAFENIGRADLLPDLQRQLKEYRNQVLETLPTSGSFEDQLREIESKGQSLEESGDSAGALQFYIKGFELAQRELDLGGHDKSQIQMWLARYLGDQGKVLRKQGNLQQASRRLMEALNIAKELTKSAPANGDWQYELYVRYVDFGDVLSFQGDLAGALKSYRDSLAINERLAKQDPSDTQRQYTLGISHERIGYVLQMQGKLPEALQEYRVRHQLIGNLARRSPNIAYYQRDLAVSYRKIGNVLRAQGDLDGALKNYRESFAINEKLAKQEPSKMLWQLDLANSYNLVGNVLRAQGNLGSTLKNYRESFTINEKLAKQEPSNTLWQSALAGSYDHIGDVLTAQGDLGGALKNYRESFTINEKLTKQDPSDVFWQRDLADNFEHVGNVLRAQGDLDGAFKNYRESLAARSKLAKHDFSNALRQSDLSSSYEKIADVLQDQHNLETALQSYRDSFAIKEKLATKDPTNVGWQADLAHSYFHIGITWAKVAPAEKQQAWAMAEKGRDNLRQLKERTTLTAEQQKWLAEIEAELGKAKK